MFKGKIKNSSFLIISNNSFARAEQFHLCLFAFQKKERDLAQINFLQNDQLKKSEKGRINAVNCNFISCIPKIKIIMKKS